jgi:hypothetical protein
MRWRLVVVFYLGAISAFVIDAYNLPWYGVVVVGGTGLLVAEALYDWRR